ncbi:molybdopterin-dependent oxidoreductase [Paenibacillus alginolyticus]|uniref:molybdopterin-dependent oxidoreductase n=1 Tax=Paenibacillus alginolyticus TaxID=59839 RepID=UPI000423E127|nr:molybdopterin-dependent oxidoreductase [Paenibacillus alginolyticus]MCY9667817.1 molybdopterin-dependent oxidoreductase [Paenibacillus alginolyticus]
MVKKRSFYYYLHFVHGLMILILLVSGTVLYVPTLRIYFVEYRWTIREVHSILGILYFIFILSIIPHLVHYLRRNRFWKKTFHICLQYSLGLGWAASGIYLWINNTAYLRIRQVSLDVHDLLALFIIPWTFGHIMLWYFRKKGEGKRIVRRKRSGDDRDRGILYSRRDVVILFCGGMASILLGGLFRWYQPISTHFLAGLSDIKRRGYFRIYSVRNDPPAFDKTTWRLLVTGLIENPLEWTWDDLMKLPKHTFTHDFHCVTGWSVLGVEWEGISFQELVNSLEPRQEGIYVKMHSADKIYTETYLLSQLMEQNVILAYKIDGKELIGNQGAPLRLFHPAMHGYKSIKWLDHIEFTIERGLGYWEEKEGYDINGYIV